MKKNSEVLCARCFYFGKNVPAEVLLTGIKFDPRGKGNFYHANVCHNCEKEIDQIQNIEIIDSEEIYVEKERCRFCRREISKNDLDTGAHFHCRNEVVIMLSFDLDIGDERLARNIARRRRRIQSMGLSMIIFDNEFSIFEKHDPLVAHRARYLFGVGFNRPEVLDV
jgi:hypothetical protein